MIRRIIRAIAPNEKDGWFVGGSLLGYGIGAKDTVFDVVGIVIIAVTIVASTLIELRKIRESVDAE